MADWQDFLSDGDRVNLTLHDKSLFHDGEWVVEFEGVIIDQDHSDVSMDAVDPLHPTLEDMIEGVRTMPLTDVDLTIRLRIRATGDRIGTVRWVASS